MRNLKRTTTLALLAIVAAFGVSTEKADAQVVVYHIEFVKSGSSINFSFFDEALFVVEGLGGTGSFIFAYTENGRDLYLTSEDSGELFFATKPHKDRAVIRATADDGTAVSHYLAMGDLDGTVKMEQRGQRIAFNAATILDGYVLSSDSEEDEEFSAQDGSIGFAGTATMRARLDRSRTNESNAANLTVAQTIQVLIEDLERQGFSDGNAVDTGDGTDPGDGTVDPGDGTVDPGDGTVDPGDGTVDTGDGTVDTGDGTVDPVTGTGEETTAATSSTGE